VSLICPDTAASPPLTGDVRSPSALAVGRTLRCNRYGRVDANSRYPTLDDDALPNCVEDDFRCVVQIEFLHEIRSVGLDR
jgi:hypothetical protein